MCKHCGKFGHDEAACYELIGYPASWGARGRGCGSRGGRAGRSGRTAGGGRGAGCEIAHAAVEQSEAAGDSSSTQSEQQQIRISRLSSEQIQRLLSLIKVPNSGSDLLSGKDTWMLDSGASCT